MAKTAVEPVHEIAKNAPISVDADSFVKLGGRPEANTSVRYFYRDAQNFKEYETVVFRGEMTLPALKTLMGNLKNNDQFIPGQVGLDDLQQRLSEWDEELDDPWHELESIGLTLADQTVPGLVEDFAKIFATEKWDGDYRPEGAPPAP